MKKILFLLLISASAPVLADTINIPGLIEEKSSEFRLSPGITGGVRTTKVEVHKMTREQIAEAKKKSINGTKIMTSAPTLWAQALNAAGKSNSNISVLGNHQACFSNPNGYPVEAGFRFTLASMGSTNLAAKTFMWGPYAEGCVRQQTFMNLHPMAAGNYPITAYSRGSIDGQSDEIHYNATLHVG